MTLDPVPQYLPLRENVTLNLQWARALPVRRAELLPESGHSYGPASTDMGNLSQLIPSIHPSIGIGAPAGVSPHTPEFARYTTLPEALGAVEEAAVGLAGAAADWLADPVLRERAQEEFDARGPAVRWEE